MNITIDHIKSAARHNPIMMVKGSAIYRGDGIKQANVRRNDVNVLVVEGFIVEYGTRYVANLELFDGEVLDYRCTCERCSKEDGACRHALALLYHFMYDLYERDVQNLLKEEDPIVSDLIENYVSKVLLAEDISPSKSMHIIPTLVMHELPFLHFSIGNDKYYVMKDIDAFLERMHTGSVYAYGKDLVFPHTLHHFHSHSQALISFIEHKRKDQQLILSQNRYAMTISKKNLTLTPVMVDQFFERMIGYPLRVQTTVSVLQVHVSDGNPALHLWISEEINERFTLRIQEKYTLLAGEHYLYIQLEETLYRCDAAFTKAMHFFLETMHANALQLYIPKLQMNAFYNTVLLPMQAYVNCETEASMLRFTPGSVQARLYLDMAANQDIIAKLCFVYDGHEYQAHTEVIPIENRNVLEEERIKYRVAQYFSLEEDWHYHINGEKNIFIFVSEGIESLKQVAELFYAESFRQMKIKQPPTISAGVRMSGDILQLHFDFQDFDVAELRQLLQAYRFKRKYYRLQDGSFMDLRDDSLRVLTDMVDELHLNEKDLMKKEIHLPHYRAMQLDQMMKDNADMQVVHDQTYQRLLKDFGHADKQSYVIDPQVAPILRNYQKSGFRWLKMMSSYHFGGILADDMGLGKTLQIISLLLDAAKQEEQVRTLVVCPASLVLNWEREIAKFAPNLKTLVIIGTAKQRQDAVSRIEEADVTLTSYDLLKRDVELYEPYIFTYHIIDEAQYIKNHNTLAAKSVKAIHSVQRFALSGTPVENTLAELWSIFDFLMPQYLYNYNHFKENFEIPIVKEQDTDVLERLRKMVKPFILRRLKKDVLEELPDKMESTLLCHMEEDQHKLYVANALQMQKDLRAAFAQSHDAQSKMMVLALLTKLRQLCCHPYLCYDEYDGSSAKLEMCMDLIHNSVQGNHKVLLFSSFTSMLDILERELKEAGIPYYVLTGATPKEKRMDLVSRFQEDEVPIFLISLKAGGTGLNLTAADVVIHYDPWWNLSAQNQATDRTHRIGQTNTVNVYNLIVKDTVEERILQLQERKYSLAQSIMEGKNHSLAAMSKEELLALFE